MITIPTATTCPSSSASVIGAKIRRRHIFEVRPQRASAIRHAENRCHKTRVRAGEGDDIGERHGSSSGPSYSCSTLLVKFRYT